MVICLNSLEIIEYYRVNQQETKSMNLQRVGSSETIRQIFIEVKRTEMKDQNTELNPFLIAGFVDGEATFFIPIYDSPKLKTGKQVRIGFKVTQGVKNVQIIHKLKKS